MKDLLLEVEGFRRGPEAAATGPGWVLILDGVVAHAAAVPPPGWPDGVPMRRGGWLCEPLADAHVHLALVGSWDPEERRRVASLGEEEALERALALLASLRAAGVAAVRDGGDRRGLALAAARVANRAPGLYAAVLPAGEPILRRGDYGGFLGRGVEDLAGGLALLAANARGGATHAKVVATGANSWDRAGEVGPPHFSPRELATLLEAAWSLGLPPMVHANGPLGWVVSARPHSVEHGYWMAKGDLAALGREGILWVPTLGAWAELGQSPGLSPPRLAVIARTDRRQRRRVAEATAAGVAVLAGSDAGCPGVPLEGGLGLRREVGRLAAAGLPPARALATSTWHARRALEASLGHPLGGLTPGGAAGFVWLARDPGRSLDALDRPLGSWLGGVFAEATHHA